MNVLHLNRFFYSGQTTHVFALVKEQQNQGHTAHLPMDGYPSSRAIETYRQTIEELKVTVMKPGDEKSLNWLAKEYRYDLVHAHSPLNYDMALRISRAFNIPYVITCHRLGLNKEENRPYFRGASALYCISPRVLKSMGDFADKAVLTANGVDLDKYKPGRKKPPVKLVLLARMDMEKQDGYYHLCRAADLLEEAEFYVASNKPPLSAKAIFLGWIDDVAGLLSKTHIVAGTGRAIVEGLASGNAALVLGQTYQGLLTEDQLKSDAYLDLSGRAGKDPCCHKEMFLDLARLIREPDTLKRLQKSGRRLAEKHYNNRVICEDLCSSYKKVLGR